MGTAARKNKPLSKKHTIRAQQLLQQAWARHQAGLLQDAESSYLSILNKYPNYAEAINLLGLLARQLGQFDLAIARFEQALAIQPSFAEAHLNFADTLKMVGRLEEAIAHLEQALIIKPNFAEAHYNLGNILQIAGRNDEAVHHFEQAITLKPDYVDAYNNLGNALNTIGRVDEAIVQYEQAIAIKPDYAEAYNNLGNTLHLLDQVEDAITHFEQAISIKPDYADPHCNLADVFRKLGRVEDAITHYEQAISIKPDYADAYNKLGNAYRELGKEELDFKCQRRAVALDRQNDVFWASFARSVESLSFNTIDVDLFQDLYDLLNHPSIAPKTLSHTVISALRHMPIFKHLMTKVNSEEWSDTDYGDTASQLSSIPLLLKIISLSSVNDLEFESMLTRLRRSMLLDLKPENYVDSHKCLPFSSALAIHCFTNEYIFYETREESAAIEHLTKEIANLVTNRHELPIAVLVALASYRALHRYPWAKILLEHDWPEDFKQVIIRQVKNPLEENNLRDQIPNLTPIQDSVSQAVRGQYEENPYPLWVKAALRIKPMTIKEFLQAPPLRFDLGDYVSPDNPEILVAGCGTGQHALKTASQFLNANMLAVDLSLSSLSYALRKTQELGFNNINYAQADIMELDKIGRSFDLIESVGVLHHLKDPLSGWKVLTNLLRPGGVMKIGLYSEAARPDVISSRTLIQAKGYSTSPEDIRQCRQDIIALAADGDQEIQKIFSFYDFFHMSELRDLIFHVQEHRFTIPQIESCLQELNLKFLGFELKDQKAMTQFKTIYPEKNAQTSLYVWHEFEMNNPDTFRGMYQFWLRKI